MSVIRMLEATETVTADVVSDFQKLEIDKELKSLWNNDRFSREGLRLLGLKLVLMSFKN